MLPPDMDFPIEVVDLSHSIGPAMPVWPGTPGPEFLKLSSVADDGYAEQSIRMSSHTGTHLDAPAHIIDGGASLDSFDPGSFFGRGACVGVPVAADGVISRELLAPLAESLGTIDFLLLHTGWSRFWGGPAYDRGYPVLDSGAADLLCSLTLKGIGIDAPSFDLPESRDYPVHLRLLSAGVLLVENMTDLHLLPSYGFLLSVFPLRITGAEACPVRAVAML
jgi:kynurenine formamidase